MTTLHPEQAMKWPSMKTALGLAGTALCALAFVGCEAEESAPAAAAGAPPAVEVGVVAVSSGEVALTRELPGRTAAYRVAEVRARVNGIVLKRLFTEGDDVVEGQLLYQIDPAPYEAALASAKATLARARAAYTAAQLQEERFRQLVKSNAVSQQTYDNALAALQVAEADIAASEAAIQVAEINVGYTQVKSPISGRIGLSMVTEGAYVQAAMATLLATVQQFDPIYVNLVQPSAEVSRLKRALETGSLERDGGAESAPVSLLLEDGSVYERTGQMQFSDVTVDRATGSVTLRALFSNPDLDLLPGVFVRASFEEARNPSALLVPIECVSRNYRGQPFVWVVEEGAAAIRVIETSRTHEGNWIVTTGLEAGETVIASNLQRLRPGFPVTTVPFTGSAASTPSAH